MHILSLRFLNKRGIMKLKLTLAILVLSSSNVAFASNMPTTFFGVKGGYQLTYDDAHEKNDPGNFIWGLYGGVNFSPVWSLDLGYQVQKGLEFDATGVDIETELIESALRYDWYLRDDFSLYARVGAAYWDMTRKQLAHSVGNSGVSPLGEFGINYRINPNWGVSAGYQYIHSIGDVNTTGEYDSSALLVNLAYRFGKTHEPTLIEIVEPKTDKSTETKVELPTVKVEEVIEPSWFNTQLMMGQFAIDSVDNDLDLTVYANILLSYPQAKVKIVGHADTTGSAEYNQKLSEERAQAIADKFEQLGVESTQMIIRGLGERSPIASNDNKDGREKNRRVEITIQGFEYW